MSATNENTAILKVFNSQECIDIFSGKKRFCITKKMPTIAMKNPYKLSYFYDKPFECCVYAKKPVKKFDKGLCLDNGKLGFVYKCNFEAAERYKMPVLNGMIIGKFTCNYIFVITPTDEYLAGVGDIEYNISDEQLEFACITREELNKFGNGENLYVWDISNPNLYSTPYPLSVTGLVSAPRNFAYINIIKGE